MDYSLPGSSDHGILQPRILESVVISSSRGSSGPRDQTHISCFVRQVLFNAEPPGAEAWNNPHQTVCLAHHGPGGTSGREPACQRRRRKRWGFDPWVGKVPWRRAWQPTPVFLPGESHGQRSLVGYSPRGLTESDRTEATTTYAPRPECPLPVDTPQASHGVSPAV